MSRHLRSRFRRTLAVAWGAAAVTAVLFGWSAGSLLSAEPGVTASAWFVYSASAWMLALCYAVSVTWHAGDLLGSGAARVRRLPRVVVTGPATDWHDEALAAVQAGEWVKLEEPPAPGPVLAFDPGTPYAVDRRANLAAAHGTPDGPGFYRPVHGRSAAGVWTVPIAPAAAPVATTLVDEQAVDDLDEQELPGWGVLFGLAAPEDSYV